MIGARGTSIGVTRGLAALIPIAMLAGCSGAQSALAPAGPQASRIGRLFWLTFGLSVAVYASMAILIVVAFVRHGRRRRMPPLLKPPRVGEDRISRAVWGGVALTVAVLFLVLISDYSTGRAIHKLGDSSDLTIKIIGHQWWWEVEYQDATPSNIVTTANEIHIPVGRTIRLDLQSSDVIHSFWVPNLHGKKDLIPGHPTRTYLRADRAGTFRGQCAEFCGLEHAFMRLIVVAEPQEQFDRWLESRRATPPEPKSDRLARGRRVFLGSTCVMCHTIAGTSAQSRVGPDLSHIASRPLIGGVLENTRGNLAGWVVDPQRIKPGIRMPMNPIKPDDLDPLLDYLESLK